jgi:type I restriction enzyme S subunit
MDAVGDKPLSEWRLCTLGDLVSASGGLIKTGPFGSQLHASEYTDDRDGIPVVMPADMVGGRVDRDTVKRVTPSVAERLHMHRLAAGDLVLARRGAIGRLAFVGSDEAGWLCGTGSMRIHASDRSTLDPQFLRYSMSSPEVTEWLLGQAVGATMANLNAKIVSALPIRVPAIGTQRRVAAILSAFDELIEINKRRIELLEKMARSLYLEWFVRYRFPGHENVEMVDSDLGPIPERWRAAPVAELATLVRGRSYRRAELSDSEGVPFLNLKCVQRGGGFRRSGLKRYTGRYKEAQRVVPGDVLVAVTDMTQERRIVAQAFRMPDLGEPFAVPSLDLALLKVADESMRILLYATLRYSEFSESLRPFANGANVLHLGVEHIQDYAIVIPDEELLHRFTGIVGPFLEAAEAAERGNRQLRATRDLLLPRIVTGRLDISEIDLGVLTPTNTE